MTQRIVPSLWFDHAACEGATFHIDAFRSALGDLAGDEERTGIRAVSHYPESGLPEFQAAFAGEVLEIRYRLAGFEVSAINSDATFAMTPSISLSVTIDPALVPDAKERIRALHDALLAGGGVELMELAEYPFSPYYSWIADRYGMTWQLSVSSGDTEESAAEVAGSSRVVTGGVRRSAAPLAIALGFLFPTEGPSGAEALSEWAEVLSRAFEDSAIGDLAFVATGEGTEALLFGSARLAGVPVSAMDAPSPQDFGFTPGVSLSLACEDQAQIDALWEGLSAVPEAEMCGWLQDRFGVSWQIVPARMGEYMSRPGAYALMAGMRKLEIAPFEALGD